MRKMTAVVSPQVFINQVISAVEFTTGARGKIAGAQLDHFGFVVSKAEYQQLQPEFATDLIKAVTVDLPTGGQVTVGAQRPERQLSWYYGTPLPALTLLEDSEFELPCGGGYVAFRVNDLDSDSSRLSLGGATLQEARLFGRPALSVKLTTPHYGVGPGVFGLFIVDQSLLGFAP